MTTHEKLLAQLDQYYDLLRNLRIASTQLEYFLSQNTPDIRMLTLMSNYRINAMQLIELRYRIYRFMLENDVDIVPLLPLNFPVPEPLRLFVEEDLPLEDQDIARIINQ